MLVSRYRLKSIFAMAWLVLITGGCKSPHTKYVMKPSGGVELSARVAPIGPFVGQTVVDAALVKTDEAGRRYIAVDDMRLPITPQGFAYRGPYWPWATLTYELSPEVAANAYWASQFVSACKELTQTTGAACIARSDHPADTMDYVYVINASVNNSAVGMMGGAQTLRITNWDNKFIIAHEIMHALGFAHEQSRPDRDQYVLIHPEHIIPSELHNFDIMFGVATNYPYNFDSIMQYGPHDFTSDGNYTVEPLPQYAQFLTQMGQRTHFSPLDIQQIVSVYGERGTEWCGMTRQPRKTPKGCFWECTWNGDHPHNGRWYLCGGCSAAELCP